VEFSFLNLAVSLRSELGFAGHERDMDKVEGFFDARRFIIIFILVDGRSSKLLCGFG
jgi:hypothetical protein